MISYSASTLYISIKQPITKNLFSNNKYKNMNLKDYFLESPIKYKWIWK